MLPPGKAATLGRREICFGGFLPGGISFRPKLLPGMTAAEDRVGLDSVFGLSYTVRLVSGIRKAPPLDGLRRRGGVPVSVSTGREVSYSRVTVSTSSPTTRCRCRSPSRLRISSSHKARKTGCRASSSSRSTCIRRSFSARLCTAAVRREGAQAQNSAARRSGRRIRRRVIQGTL